MKIGKYLGLMMLSLSSVLGLQGCKSDSHSVYVLTSTGTLMSFDSDKPTTINSSVSISGLNSGESVVQIDYRPSAGALYGLTSDNRVVTINMSSGLAAAVASSGFTSDTLSSVVISMDPVSDLMRVITSSANDLVTPSTGVLYSTDTAVAFDSSDTNSSKSPVLAGIAYSNHQSGVSSTTLYGLDITTQTLVRVGNADVSSTTSADSGDLHTIGSVGTSFSANSALTIVASSGDAYAVLTQSGSASAFYTIDLSSGAATKVDTIGDGSYTIISLTAEP